MKRTVILAMAIIALAIIAIGSALFALGLTSRLWIGSRDVVGERAALDTLTHISDAQTKYVAVHGEYGTFDRLVREEYLEEGFADRSLTRRYIYNMKVVPPSADKPSFYSVNADPREKPRSDVSKYIFGPTWRHFYIDSQVSGIRVNKLQPASASDPPLKE
jgi:hypothetical protein